MKKAFAFVGIGQLTSAACQALFVLVVLRQSGAAEFAQYVLALASFGIATGLASSAFQRAFFIEHKTIVAGYGRGVFLNSQIIVGALAVAVLQILTPLRPGVALLVVCYVAAGQLFENIRWQKQLEEKFLSYTVMGVNQNALSLLLLVPVAFVMGSITASGLLLVQIGSRVLVAGTLLLADRATRAVLSPRISIAMLRDLVLSGYGFLAVYHALDGLLTQFPVMLLSHVAADREVASYGAAMRYVGIIMVALLTARAVLLPMIGTAASADEIGGQRRQYLTVSIGLTALIAIPVATADYWIPFIDGSQYLSSIEVFQILALRVVVTLWANFEVTVLMRHRRQKALSLYALIGLAVNASAGVTLIPRFGAPGAAIGSLLGYGVFNLLAVIHSRRLRHEEPE